ncbi:hypothetical protein GALMADRAFT_157751 [Galerina marginata CBS 339.88]|uniref:Nucleoside phosphatase GDA1/CD39 n=1 Tax=Galerina marginata (strain CBS 339.88) TaxID=685588 RepID=A0A067T1V9_GALM3|nr:hypothetical protein GALMADRAFT_157751 [Galerina marginata CBS 339.88]
MPESEVVNQYAFILDAGSSGTRLYVYEWTRWSGGDSPLPEIRNPLSHKQTPGISNMVKDKELEGAYRAAGPAAASAARALLQSKVDEHLQPLFEKARQFAVGAGLDSTIIPLFVLGTAGIRDLLPDSERQYNDLLSCMTQSSRNTEFNLQECGAISGEAEALYGWISSNFTLIFPSLWSSGTLASKTLGYAEMGGASAQIAFSPSRAVSEPYNGVVWKVRLGDKRFELFLGSYPLGMDKGVELYFETLIAEHLKGGSSAHMLVTDPGKPPGLVKTFRDWTLEGPIYNGETIATSTTGTPKLGPQVGLVVNKLASIIASAVNSEGPRLPSLSEFDAAIKAHDFIGGANFWYSTRTLFGVDDEGKPKTTDFSFAEFRLEVFTTLSVPWDRIHEKLRHANPVYLKDAWIKAMWANEVLTRQFRLDDGDPRNPPRLEFKPFDGYVGMELTWTMGRLVHFITGNHATQRERDEVRGVQFRPFLDARAA